MAARKTNKSSRNRIFFFIAGYTLVFGLLASFGYIELVDVQNAQEEAAKEASANILGKSYYRLPRMDLTLSSFQGESHHARIDISLEIDSKNVDRFDDFQPRVSDRIIRFMRLQDVNELQHAAAMRSFRHDLLREVNDASKPLQVSDLVFREFVVR